MAAQPDNPLSPFSAQSSPAREEAVDLYRQVLAGSAARPEPALAEALPELLWLYHLGVVLFWVHDRSPGCRRTRMLVERTVPLLDRVVGLSRLRVLRPVTGEIVALIRDLLRPDA